MAVLIVCGVLGALSVPRIARAQPGMTPPAAPGTSAPPSASDAPPPPIEGPVEGSVEGSVEGPRRAIELTARAIAAARAGQCSAARAAGAEARASDPGFYARAVATYAILAACESQATPDSAGPAPAEAVEPPRPAERGGILFGGGFGVGNDVRTFDLRLGGMITPRIGVFGSALTAFSGPDGGLLLALGVRLSQDRFFLDLRVGDTSRGSSCDFDEPCTTSQDLTGFLGAGFELLRSRTASLDLHLEAIVVGDTDLFVATGLSFTFF